MSSHIRPVAAMLLMASSLGCARAFDPAHFSGSCEPRRARPEALLDLFARTAELEAIGRVNASCTVSPGYRRLDGDALSDLDCSAERLTWAMRESAASAGGDALVALSCRSLGFSRKPSESHVVHCTAEVARFKARSGAAPGAVAVPRWAPSGRPAPSASEVQRIDEPDASLAFRISLRFEPAVPTFERKARRTSEVKELSRLPIADLALGDLAASCEGGCDERALRHGVLVAAGRMGVPDVVAVRCFGTGASKTCVGTLAAPMLDE